MKFGYKYCEKFSEQNNKNFLKIMEINQQAIAGSRVR